MENFSIPPAAFIFPIILLGIAMHWYMMTWKNKKDRGLVESLGDELGLEFEATPIMLSALLAEFQMVKKAETCEFANCLSGELHGEQICVFNFQGVEKTITIYGHTVVAVESVKADLPTFQIEPRGYMDQKLCSLTNDTKEMLRGDEDFRCYRVTSSASESRVEQVFTPEVREYLKQKKWHVESGLHHLLVYKHNKVLPNTQFADFTEEVIKLYHLLAAARTGRTEPRDQIMVGDDGRLRLTKV